MKTHVEVLQNLFETEWQAAAPHVMSYCRHSADQPSEAEEIFQCVAVRAWHGYATFKHEATFLTWVLTIARHESARFMSRKYERLRMEASLEQLTENTSVNLSQFSYRETWLMDYDWLPKVIQAATQACYLSQSECTIIQTRLKHPDTSWEEIGQRLNVKGASCAVIHTRAIPKLRVFLFLHHPNLLGGLPAISVAYHKALVEQSYGLTQAEAEAFEWLVIQQRIGYRKSGWRLALRSACSKVIRWIDTP